MITLLQPRSEAYLKFIPLQRKLEELIAEGKSDSPEADLIRDSMDGPWCKMTQEERELTRTVSKRSLKVDDACDDRDPCIGESKCQECVKKSEFERGVVSGTLFAAAVAALVMVVVFLVRSC